MAVTGGPDPVVTEGLVFYMDPANIIPSSNLVGSKAPGTISGATFSTNNAGTYIFDGSNDEITFADSSEYEVSAVALQIWVNLSGTQGNYASIFGRDGGGSSPYKIRTYGTSTRTTGLQIYNINNANAAGPQLSIGASGADLIHNVWNNLCFTYDYNSGDGARMKVYVNGVQHSTNNNGGNTIKTTSNQPLDLMTSDTDNAYMGGKVGPSMIYNRELSATEVLQNYNALKGRFA